MKYRSDFVTNSSSSSFIVAYKNSSEMVKDLRQFAKNHENDEWNRQYSDVVYDILRNKITYTEALKIYTEEMSDKIHYMLSGGRAYFHYQEKYGGHQKWVKSAEFKQMHKELLNKEVEKFKKSVNPRGYFAFLTYSDSDGYYDVESDLHNMLKGLCIKFDNR